MRHGQTHANVSGELDTAHPGLDLTDLGRAQAAAAAKAIANALLEKKVFTVDELGRKMAEIERRWSEERQR